MQYSKQEVPLESKDISSIKTASGIIKFIPFVAAAILGMMAVMALLVLPHLFGWLVALIVVAFIIGAIFLAFFLLKKLLVSSVNNEINNGTKIVHKGKLTNKRSDMLYNNNYGRHELTDTYFITLNETEIKIGDARNYNNITLYDSLQIGKNYKVSQSVKNPDFIFGVEEII